MDAYVPKNKSASTFLDVRNVRYHVREWGDAGAPLLVMLHGWMDVSASFQFLVDELVSDWHVVAPDWRGYGLTGWSDAGCYWLPDYLGDLDALLEHYAQSVPVNLVGHSMGGNMALMYSGIRPERIARLVNLEGLGMASDAPSKAPGRLAKWLAELRDPPTLTTYDSLEAVVRRLQKTNPRLPEDRARFLAQHWAEPSGDGRYRIQGDPAHKVINPYLYRAEEATACWSAIAAPTLWVMARESAYAQRMDALAGYAERIASIRDVRRVWIEDAGHMMHHDQPREIAELIEAFMHRA